VNVALEPGASANPDSASVWIAPSLLIADIASIVPFGVTTKNSESFEIAPSATLGTHPPLGVEVPVRATMWKMTVAFPLFSTETLSEFGVRLAAVSWNFVMS
jgi:hypothetical protein